MNEHGKSCMELATKYTHKDLNFHFSKQGDKLYDLKCEYKINHTNALLLEVYYYNYVVNTLGDTLQRKEKEDESSLPSNEEKNNSKEDHDDQPNEESIDDFWTMD